MPVWSCPSDSRHPRTKGKPRPRLSRQSHAVRNGLDYTGSGGTVKVHRLRHLRREDVVLSEKTISFLESNLAGFIKVREGVRKMGAFHIVNHFKSGDDYRNKTAIWRRAAVPKTNPDQRSLALSPSQQWSHPDLSGKPYHVDLQERSLCRSRRTRLDTPKWRSHRSFFRR